MIHAQETLNAVNADQDVNTDTATQQTQIEEKVESDAPVRDPFATGTPEAPTFTAPVSGERALSSELVLQGIAMGSERASAVINGRFYRKGEKKDGFELVDVRKKEVDVLFNGTSKTLRMIAPGKKDKEVTYPIQARSSSMPQPMSPIAGGVPSDGSTSPEMRSPLLEENR